MSNLNTVPEGAPLTYELINSIINAVNQLQKTETANQQIINAYGARIGQLDTDEVLILAGQFDLSFSKVSTGQTKNLTARQEVSFAKDNSFTKKPYVAIAIEDPTPSDGNMSFVIASLTNVTQSGFTVRARRLMPPKGVLPSDNIVGTYIAIGSGASRA